MQACDERAESRRKAMCDRDEHAAQIHRMHADAGNDCPVELTPRDRRSMRGSGHNPEQRGRGNESYGEKRERAGVSCAVPGDDESGAPKEHEQHRRKPFEPPPAA